MSRRIVRKTSKKQSLAGTPNDNGNNDVGTKNANLPSKVKTQTELNLFHVEVQGEFDGIEMGVLENGIPYFSGRSLQIMCGISSGTFSELTTNWNESKLKPRGIKIQELLQEYEYFEDQLYIKAMLNGQLVNAFTEPVCMAFLEYYGFVADPPKQKAQNVFRTLAKTKFREFVYNKLGYSIENKILDIWKPFHDRVTLTEDEVPSGYFCVFREINGMLIPLIKNNIPVNCHTVPDISVGLIWAAYWKEKCLAEKYGERITFNHNYPDSFPQSLSNPQLAQAYPNEALGAFRNWFNGHYIQERLPIYLKGQVKQNKIDHATANKALKAVGSNQLPPPKPKKLPKPGK